MKGTAGNITKPDIIGQAVEILNSELTVEDTLQGVCNVIPMAWNQNKHISARIIFQNRIFSTNNINGLSLVCKESFEVPGRKNGTIELYVSRKDNKNNAIIFESEARKLLSNIASLTSGSISKKILKELLADNRERLKELNAINQTNAIIAKGMSISETLREISEFLPRSWQFPRLAAARIIYEGRYFTSRKFSETKWMQQEDFVTIDNKKGTIEIFYLKEPPRVHQGPFLKEERHLLKNIARLISGYLNNIKGRELISKRMFQDGERQKSEEYRQSLVKTKQPLQLFFNKQIIDKYIYLDMMKYKVKEILFVATLYDAFILQNEDSFFEQFMGEIYQYSLFSLPRITGVSSVREAMDLLETTRFDLVILMVGLDTEGPIKLSSKIKQKKPDLPVYMLLNQQSNIKYFEDLIPNTDTIDKIFIWNGDSQIFFAIVKSIEDAVNVENDTKVGLVRVILLVENSARYYSKYLPMLYSVVFGQIQQLIAEVERNELDKISKMRSRPKILHAYNYEDAIYLYHKYKDFLLCVISDVEFEKDGVSDKKAGIEFVSYVKSQIKNIPTLLQSFDVRNAKVAESLDCNFINKNSETLLNDLKKFLTFHLGFGDFIFRDKEGKQLAVAKTFKEFESLLSVVPDESLVFHAEKNQFSIWLMARGEIQLAKMLNPVRITDFVDINEFRQFNVNIVRRYMEEKKKGRIINFEDADLIDEKNIVSLAGGSLGGKGRGLAFINTLIYNLDFSEHTREIQIRTPRTAIIGTDEFELFIENNNLHEKVFNTELKYEEIKALFVKSKLSPQLKAKLKIFIDQITRPIAVRSSSISEDSLTQPFAGIFETYIIPNNHTDKRVRLERLITTIKLVYASIYSDKARKYFQVINHKIEDDRMAVILQELVGNQYDNYYYPHISGIAQSYNFYPYEHMKPEEGFAIAAMGLGSYVVEGGRAYRFSPRYPDLEILTPEDIIKSTQVCFYALDLTKQDINYIKYGEKASLSLLDICTARKHGTLDHCASMYNRDNDIIEPGVKSKGPIIINFADILKYKYIPLANTIRVMLDSIKDSLGSPVEIEFAVDLTKDKNNPASFYLLQIKPLVGNQLSYDINLEDIDKSKILLMSSLSLGNGVIDNIYDFVYIDTTRFDKLRTLEMAEEIERINDKMIRQHRKYILMGQGRWGTRDRHLGIPTGWSQISNARVIVEISLADFPIDASLGSHFFHNITSMNIGYLSVLDSSHKDFIKWEVLNKQKPVERTRYFRHIRFSKPLTVYMDGKKKISVIVTN
jgi:hypothetical protein